MLHPRDARRKKKGRKENAKERRVDQLDARMVVGSRVGRGGETDEVDKMHLNAAERMFDAALKCKKQMRMDLEKSMRRAFDAFVREAEEVAKGARKHTARRTGDERDEAALRKSRNERALSETCEHDCGDKK